MFNLTESLMDELTHEASTTRLCLARVPAASLSWKPHAKSRGLGELAGHIAGIPGVFIGAMESDDYDRLTAPAPATGSVDAILATFDEGVRLAKKTLGAMSTEKLFQPWRYRYGDKVIFEMPRLAIIRGMGLNHLIHHRAQLTVYLRLLDVAVPGVYGPSADEK